MIDLNTVWSLWQRGLIPSALMLLFHLTNTFVIARWTWLSTVMPWLANKRWLAIASAAQGATAGLVPLAIAGDLTASAIVFAVITGLAQFLRPTPQVVVIATADQGKVRLVREEAPLDRTVQAGTAS